MKRETILLVFLVAGFVGCEARKTDSITEELTTITSSTTEPTIAYEATIDPTINPTIDPTIEPSAFDISRYNSFIKGEGSCNYCDDIYTLEDLRFDELDKYTYLDVDKDGEDELIIDTCANLYIIKQIDNNLEIIHDGCTYETIYCSDYFCGIYYSRDGGTPHHIDYQFETMDSNGNTQSVSYSWYDNNENYEQDSEDEYYKDENIVEEDIWQQEVDKYNPSIDTVTWTIISPEYSEGNIWMDTEAMNGYLEYDWSSDNVLSNHELCPNDEGTGWTFTLMDIDFDNNPEMLVSFPSNGAGNDCIYLYHLVNGEVVHYTDIVATSQYKLNSIRENGISYYINVHRIDAFRNQNGDVKYFTTDIGEVNSEINIIIYEVSFAENDAVYTELAKIQFPYGIPDEGVDEDTLFFFKGNELDSIENFNAAFNDYLRGYQRIQMPNYTSDVVFPNDFMQYSAEEKQSMLEALYEDFAK